MEENISIKCKQHPLEFITNLCMNDTCKVGLCSLCICHHTELHVQHGSSPIYKPIKVYYDATLEKIKSHISALEQDKDRIIKMMKNITERKQIFRDVMHQAKMDALRMVEQVFQEMEARFEEEVKQEKNKTGYHSMYMAECLCKKVNREIDTLVGECQGLASPKFIEIAKNIDVNSLNEAKKLHYEVSREIKLNEEFVPNLVYRKQYLGQFELATRRLLSLTFMIPNQTNSVLKKFMDSMDYKQNEIKKSMNNTVCEIKTNLSICPTYIVKQSIIPQQSTMRTSRIFETSTTNIFPRQIMRNQSSIVNIIPTTRSNSNNSKILPQFLNSGTFSMINQRPSLISDVNMGGDKIIVQYSKII